MRGEGRNLEGEGGGFAAPFPFENLIPPPPESLRPTMGVQRGRGLGVGGWG